MCALSNFAAANVTGRDHILEIGIVDKIINILSSELIKGGLYCETYEMIFNLCKGKPDPPISSVFFL